MIAFVFSSLADRESAHLCAARLRDSGVAVIIALDAADGISDLRDGEILTAFPRRGRLFGAACSVGIAETMTAHRGDHETLAKVDADTLILPGGVQWLQSAKVRAHGFRVGKHYWSGIWAAPAETIATAAARIRAATDCTGCPEAFLFGSFFRRHGGALTAAATASQVWRSGRDIDPAAWLVTLPSGLPDDVRAAEAADLLSNHLSFSALAKL